MELENNDLLYQYVEARIKSIKTKKKRYLFCYRMTKVVVFLAGAAITILTGWKGEKEYEPENTILLLSAGIALIAVIEGFFNLRDKGKSYDVFLFDLRRLRDQICFDFAKSPEIYQQNKDRHFIQFQEILQCQKAIILNSDSAEE